MQTKLSRLVRTWQLKRFADLHKLAVLDSNVLVKQQRLLKTIALMR